MRELPILFSGAMVRAILEGRKTQTRRVVKARPGWPIGFVGGAGDQDDPSCYGFEDLNTAQWWTLAADGSTDNHQIPCPYGAPGDRLWVRETHDVNRLGVETFPDGRERFYARIAYKADDGRHEADITERLYQTLDETESRGWTPSIHMPRWASRITLEITGVRVERLQAISEEDAIAEGIDGPMCAAAVSRAPSRGELLPAAVHGFSHLWECLNASRGFGWHLNPWVWVVEFKVIKAIGERS